MSLGVTTETPAQATPTDKPAPYTASPRVIALIVASGFFMEQLDATVLTTALPAMADSFHTAPVTLNIALTAYLLSLTVFIPASGQIADRFGSRLVFRIAIAIFTLSSILCGLSTSVDMLVFSRVLQGLGGAMMVPVGRLLIIRSVSKADRMVAISWMLVPGLLGPILGPPIGGFIVTYFSWRWIFGINIPIGIIGIVMVSLFIRDVHETAPKRFDFRGMVLSGIALSALMIALETTTQAMDHIWTVAAFVIAFIAGGLYVWHAQHHVNPVLKLALMRIQTFRLSIVAGTLFRLGNGGTIFLLPLMLQLGFGYSAARSGAVTFISAVAAMFMKGVSIHFQRRWGHRNVLLWNGVIAVLLLVILGLFRPDWPLMIIYVILVCNGAVNSLQYNAYGSIVYADITLDDMSYATSFYATIQQFSSMLGISFSAFLLVVSSTLMQHSGNPQLTDFTVAFETLAILGAIPFAMCWRLPYNAGSELTGYRSKKVGAAN